jgi:hypothetical protein
VDHRIIYWQLQRTDISDSLPRDLSIVPGRLPTSNENVVETLRALTSMLCVTNAQLISSDSSGHAIAEYIEGYMLQNVKRLRAAAILVLVSGLDIIHRPSIARDTGTPRRTAIHWIERYCNSIVSSEELSEQQLALAALGYDIIIHSEQHTCIFVDALVILLLNKHHPHTRCTCYLASKQERRQHRGQELEFAQ